MENVVVLTIDKRTNRVVRVVKGANAPDIHRGEWARDAVYTLLTHGYQEVSQVDGRTYLVLGYALNACADE
ncbi:hypothetical protein [Alicyclobacillus vulcanalis]|uniref:Uncharacterized protein n=1 Tax=Alicyclobacillus vulcanalis TaxID=252246 RepID=A0A1N7JLT8_9BACL|nr:hypothetical protein [Alicyclobacillus vulcanalis]SIS50226.1 hypothetical protein SAMN05421799_10157 [Alicyclobacillus vulcanalis]